MGLSDETANIPKILKSVTLIKKKNKTDICFSIRAIIAKKGAVKKFNILSIFAQENHPIRIIRCNIIAEYIIAVPSFRLIFLNPFVIRGSSKRSQIWICVGPWKR